VSEGVPPVESEPGAPSHYASGLSCPKCCRVNPPTDEFFASYFASGTAPCCGCCEAFDPWNQALELMNWLPNAWTAFFLLPCRKTHFELPLNPNESSAVDLSAKGIPPDAEILDVHVTTLGPPEGPPLFPALMLLGVKTLHLDPIPRFFGLYGADFGKDSTGKASALLNVTWVDPGPDEISIHHLADASKRFAAGRYAAMVVSANIAVEAALAPAMQQWIRLTCSSEDVGKLFGKDGISYARQIILTKMASKVLGIADMPGRVRNLLDELRDERNGIVHTGAPREKGGPLDKDRAAAFLAAAAFGYQYARYLRNEIGKRAAAERG